MHEQITHVTGWWWGERTGQGCQSLLTIAPKSSNHIPHPQHKNPGDWRGKWLALSAWDPQDVAPRRGLSPMLNRRKKPTRVETSLGEACGAGGHHFGSERLFLWKRPGKRKPLEGSGE